MVGSRSAPTRTPPASRISKEVQHFELISGWGSASVPKYTLALLTPAGASLPPPWSSPRPSMIFNLDVLNSD